MIKKTLFLCSISLFLSTSLFAACAFKNTVEVKMLSAGFEAWKAVTSAMEECGNVQAELDQEFRTKQPAAFAANPSLYHIGGVANGTLVPLLEAGTIRTLDDLVARYGKNLKPNQLRKHNGNIIAIAMMVNNQHFMYRKDIFADLKIPEPKTYADVLKAAEKIKKAAVVDYAMGGTYKSGWNIGEEFINMYLGLEGTFFTSGNKPAINNAKGKKALSIMKKLTAYMDPEYLVADSTYVQKQFQQGKIAMANLWATRAAAMNDANESQVVGKVKMSAAPKPMKSSKPASTLWWDGIVIAKNISDEEAKAAFRVAMEGIDTEMVRANNDAAVWLIEGYTANELSEGAIKTFENGASGYPASTAIGLMHTALGNNLADYFTGKKSSKAVLKAVESDYITAAKEKGLIN